MFGYAVLVSATASNPLILLNVRIQSEGEHLVATAGPVGPASRLRGRHPSLCWHPDTAWFEAGDPAWRGHGCPDGRSCRAGGPDAAAGTAGIQRMHEVRTLSPGTRNLVIPERWPYRTH